MHYSKEELDMYQHGDMSVLARIACKAHLQTCQDCQKLLATLKEEDKLLDDLRTGLDSIRRNEEK